MKNVSVEVREGTGRRRMRISAPSIERALRISRGEVLGCTVRLVFPIDPGAFFVPEDPGRRKAP
jgi:hypothetical protein